MTMEDFHAPRRHSQTLRHYKVLRHGQEQMAIVLHHLLGQFEFLAYSIMLDELAGGAGTIHRILVAFQVLRESYWLKRCLSCRRL